MAADTKITGELIAALANNRMKGLTDQIAKKCPLFDQLRQAGRVKFGQGWIDGQTFAVHYQNSHKNYFVSMTDWQQAQGHAFNDKQLLSLPGSNLVYALAQSALLMQRVKNLDERGSGVMFDLIAQELAEVMQAGMEVFCQDLYADGTQRSTNAENQLAPIVGLEAAIDDNNTYANIDRSAAASVNLWWRSQVKSTTAFSTVGTVLPPLADGIAYMRQIADQITIKGYCDNKGTPKGLPNSNETWDAIFCDVTSYERYQAQQDSKLRFNLDSQTKKMDTRVETVFDGHPVYRDAFTSSASSDGRMFFIQYAALELLEVNGGSADEKEGLGNELFKAVAVDRTNLVQQIVIASQHWFGSRKPRVLGKLKISG